MREPIVPSVQFLSTFSLGCSGSDTSQTYRIRLFRIQQGLLSDPPGLDSDE